MLENELPGGERVTKALVEDPRRRWALDRVATQAQAEALVAFHASHRGSAFYFYDVNDTVGCAYDATGVSTVGRFKAIFAGPLDVQVNAGVAQVKLEVAEVA